MALTNNTTGASIYDLGNIIKADSIAEVTDILKDAETKQLAMRQQEMQQQQQMQQQQLQAKAEEEKMKLEFEANENDKERQKDLLVAEIKSAGYGAMQDIDQNQMSDYRDAVRDLKQTEQYQSQMEVKREKISTDKNIANQRMQIERERLITQRDVANKNLQIARTNKNKYDMMDSKDSDAQEAEE